MFLDLHITDYCNLDCKHCYLLSKNNMHMEEEMFKDIINQYNEFENGNRVIFSGGDPSLHPKLKEFIEFVHNKDMSLTIITNGNDYKNVLPLLKEGDTYQVSIDGNEFMHDWLRGEGSFEVATNALEMADELDIKHSFMMTIHNGNKFYVKHVIKKIFYPYNCDNMSLTFYEEFGDSVLKQTDEDEFFNLLRYAYKISNQKYRRKCYEKNQGCVAGVTGGSILPDGTYWDCSRNQEVIGNYPTELKEVFTLGDNKKAKETCRCQ